MEDLNLVTVYILHPAVGILVWAKRLGVLSTSGILEPFNRLFNLGFILLDGHIIFRVRRTLRGFSQAAVTFTLEPPATGEFKATTSPMVSHGAFQPALLPMPRSRPSWATNACSSTIR